MKRQDVWNELHGKMGAKRTKIDAGTRGKSKKGNAPHEVIVQRLASEPDNKQTYRPVQPREFVSFEFEDLSLANLKKACAAHFGLPAGACDVLVTNKGPSCSNIAQIPHRKDKVYLVRFVVVEETDEQGLATTESKIIVSSGYRGSSSSRAELLPAQVKRRRNTEQETNIPTMETTFPASVSIADLLKAGKLVKPKSRNKVLLTFEKFDVKNRDWQEEIQQEVFVDTKKFASGAFRDAFHARACGKAGKTQHGEWVVKTYNSKALDAIDKLNSSIESHTRKQVQMHAVARHLAKNFALKAPTEFGECFEYNRSYYTTYNDKPATIEEYVPGSFVKYVNNDGKCVSPPNESTDDVKELFAKAQCLVHHSYHSSDKKLMLLDIQGSKYNLYDPEIATSNINDDGGSEENQEIYFCYGNCTYVGIEEFVEGIHGHICNDFCLMMDLPNDGFSE